MTAYCCYFLTADLHVGRAETIEAHDDARAIEIARRTLALDGTFRALELWKADSRVGSEFTDDVEPIERMVLAAASSGIFRSVI